MNPKKLISALLTGVIMCTFPAALPAKAENYVTLHFNLDSPDIVPTISPLTDEPYDLSDSLHPEGSYYTPGNLVTRPGYELTGWTIDGLHAYKNYSFIEMTQSITLTPIWKKNDAVKHSVTFSNEYMGRTYKLPDEFVNVTAAAGELIELSDVIIVSDFEYCQIGWLYNDVRYDARQNLIMPDEDITIYPLVKYYNNVYYSPGVTDRVTDNRKVQQKCMGGWEEILQGKELFHRQGFDLLGWSCEEDGNFYEPNKTFTMPDEDLHMNAVWAAKHYTFLFRNLTTWRPETFTVSGITDEVIICPEPKEGMNGLVFSGWQLDNKLYKAGEKILLDGSHEDSVVELTALWVKDVKPFSMGDVNGDKAVNASDASLVLAEYASVSTGDGSILTAQQQTAADTNSDGTINSTDASRILAYYAYASTGGNLTMAEWDL